MKALNPITTVFESIILDYTEFHSYNLENFVQEPACNYAVSYNITLESIGISQPALPDEFPTKKKAIIDPDWVTYDGAFKRLLV